MVRCRTDQPGVSKIAPGQALPHATNSLEHARLQTVQRTAVTCLSHKSRTQQKIKPLTLCKRLLHVSPYPCERVLRRVGRGGAGGRRPNGHGDGPADGVAGGGARRACPLGLERQCEPLMCFPKNTPHVTHPQGLSQMLTVTMTSLSWRKSQLVEMGVLNLRCRCRRCRTLLYYLNFWLYLES